MARRVEAVAGSWILVLGIIALLPVGMARGACAEEAETESVPAEEEELDREAKKRHEAEVKRLVRYLKTEKNQMIVRGRLRELGAQGTRVARDALMQYVVGNKNHDFVGLALSSLAKIGGKKAVEFLCGAKALRSKNFLIAYAAATALAQAMDERATEPLLHVMTAKSTKIKVVSACAEALAKSAAHDADAVEVLFEYSRHRKDTIRAYVVEALGHLGTDAAVARLTEALESDKNTRVREYAARGLGHTKRSDVIPVLRKALGEQTAHTVRQACMGALRRIQAD